MQFLINGGNRIFGKIKCNGAKNFVNKAMIATLLSNEESCLENIPFIGETDMVIQMIKSLGCSIRRTNDFVFINPTVNMNRLQYPDHRTNRLPILFLGILIHRFKSIFVPHTGGDQIGQRSIDFHIDLFRKFGCDFTINDSGYLVSRTDELIPANIVLPYPSVGATENLLFLSVLTHGVSYIDNIAIEPEIISLIEMLNKMGANIQFLSERKIKIIGVQSLHGVKFKALSDRLEAASWASLAAASNGEIEVIGCQKDILNPFIEKFEEAGGKCTVISDDSIVFSRKHTKLHGINLTTDVFPGFSTDWQPIIAIMLSQAEGKSYIHDTVYENRMGYLNILKNIGLNVSVNKCIDKNCRYHNHYDNAIIEKSALYSPANTALHPPDIRAGLAYLIASVLSNGMTILTNTEHIERGYGDMIEKLSETNVNIKFFSSALHVYQQQIQY